MAISIDWGNTNVIFVPKADLTLIQATPTEIRELDLDWFRLQLKALEDDEEGIPFPDTHVHNTEVTLGGLTFARMIEVLDPYTVTFEDGQYAVNLVGANSNVADKTNVNQVSVRPQNSAGLISTPLIEVASFENGVSWDPQNSTGKAIDYTTGLAGSRNLPLLYLTDVLIVAAYRKFNSVYVLSDDNVLDAGDFDRFIFQGQAHVNNKLTIQSAASVVNCVFQELHVTGVLDGGNQLSHCVVENLLYINGHIHDCGLIGDLELGGGANAVFADCKTVEPSDPPVLDMGGIGQSAQIPNYAGLLTVRNMSGANFLGIGLSAGEVVLDSGSVTGGTVYVSGIGELKDEFGDRIVTGTWNGGVTVINTTVTPGQVADDVWSRNLLSSPPPQNTAARWQVEAGFQNGAIWLDEVNGDDANEGTVSMPVQTFSRAKAQGLEYAMNRIRVVSLMNSDLTESLEGFEVISDNTLGKAILNFNNQPVAGGHFEGLGLKGDIGEASLDVALQLSLNESSGDQASDTSGNGRHGTLVNMEDGDWIAGKLNNALRFGGTDEYVSFGDVLSYERDQELSVEFWLRTDNDTDTMGILGRQDRITGTGWMVYMVSGNIRFIMAHSSVDRFFITADATVADGQWHHWVFTYDGSSDANGVTVYRDNVPQSITIEQNDLVSSIVTDAAYFNVGARDDYQWWFIGDLDEIVIYEKVLSATEVAARWNGGSGTETIGIEFTISAEKCVVYGPMSGIGGSFLCCMFLVSPGDVFAVRRDTTRFVDCYADPAQGAPPRFNFSGVDVDVAFRRWTGPIEIDAVDNASSYLEIDCASAAVTILSTCTAGIIVVRGNCVLTDNSGAGCTVLNKTTSGPKIDELHRFAGLDADNPMVSIKGVGQIEQTAGGVTRTHAEDPPNTVTTTRS